MDALNQSDELRSALTLAQGKECAKDVAIRNLQEALIKVSDKSEQLEKKLKKAEEALEQSRQSYRELEPCGHPKNFLMGDEYGHFTCTVCKFKTAEEALAVSSHNLLQVQKYAEQLETVANTMREALMQCSHDQRLQQSGQDDWVLNEVRKALASAQALLGSEAPDKSASSDVERDVKVPSQGGRD